MVSKIEKAVIRLITIDVKLNWLIPNQIAQQGKGVGSGFFIDKSGHFITCAHVVDNAAKITFETSDSEKYYEAKVIGFSSDYDLALCKAIDYKPKHFLKLSPEKYIAKGGIDTFAYGFPLGVNNMKTTKGVLSGMHEGMYQTDTPLNPGNSGGPLCLKNGNVIGVNFSGIITAANVGFAVPIIYFHKIKDKLGKKDNIVYRPSKLGIEYFSSTPNTMKLIDNKDLKNKSGVYISRVFKNSPADKIGLKNGDFLLEINNKNVGFKGIIEDQSINQWMPNTNELSFKFFQKSTKKIIKKKVKLFDYQYPIKIIYPLYESVYAQKVGPFIFMNLTLNHITSLPLPVVLNDIKPYIEENPDQGYVILTHIGSGSPEIPSDLLHPGILIQEINNQPINDVKDIQKALKKLPPKKSIHEFKLYNKAIIGIPKDLIKSNKNIFQNIQLNNIN